MNITLLDGFLFQNFAGNFLESCVHSRLGGDLLRRFVQFESKIPSQNVHSGLLRRVRAFARSFPHLGGDSVHVGASYRRVHGSNMHHAPGLDAVQPDVSADWSGVVKLKDEFAVGGLAFLLFFSLSYRSQGNSATCHCWRSYLPRF